MKYAILNAVYDLALFRSTVAEYETNHCVTWETRLTSLRTGDVVYLCYGNLPMEREARILFRGRVLESNLLFPCDQIYGNGDPTLVKAITIHDLKAVACADNEKYCKSRLYSDFGISNTFGGIYLHPCHEALIRALEEDTSDCRTMAEALDYFCMRTRAHNEQTFCEGGKNHPTFIKPDGTKYFEIHHLVPASAVNQRNLPESLVQDDQNKFQLCSNCHNEIHYGYVDGRRALIRRLYLRRSNWYDQNFSAYAAPMTVLDWLYRLYRVEKVQVGNEETV